MMMKVNLIRYICTAPTETPDQPIATIANYLTGEAKHAEGSISAK